MTASVRKFLLPAAKGALAAGLLAWVLAGVDWSRLATLLGRLNVLLAAGGALCLAGSVVTSAIRWRGLLAVQDVRLSPGRIVRLAFLAELFSNVLPGQLGGDAVKAYCVARQTPRKAHVVVSVFVDRLMGVCGLAILAAVMLGVVAAAGLARGAALRKPALSVLVVAGAVAAGTALLVSGRLRRLLGIQGLLGRLPFYRHLAAAGDALSHYGRHRRAMLRAAGLTFLAQGLSIGSVALAGAALHLPIPWHAYVLYVPLIVIVSAVPVTPGGIGVMEQLYVLYLSPGDAAVAVALALLVRATMVVVALPGAVVAATGPKLPAPGRLRQALETPAAGPEPAENTPEPTPR